MEVYLAQLERFGYMLTAVGRTEAEARDAIISKYKEVYVRENGSDPAKDFFHPIDDRSYLQTAMDELFVQKTEFGEVMWL